MKTSEVETPAILVDLDRLERNVRRAQDYCDAHGIRFRPHMKTHKTPEIGRMQIAQGAVGLTCAKLGEVEIMAAAGLSDLMLAYPVWGRGKLQRLTAVAERCRLTVVFDSTEVADAIAEAARAAGTTIGALVEVDTGMRRCGVAPGPDLVALCRRAAELPGLAFRGLMTYQGWQNGPTEAREAQMRAEGDRVAAVVDELSDAGLTCEVVSGGTSPGLFFAHLAPAITENRSGTYVFNDRNMVSSGAATWDDCAMRIAVTVISNAVPGQIVVDGGSKTFTSDATPGFEGFGRFVEDPELTLWKMNEEHGYTRLGAGSPQRRIGERLHVIPNHVCVAMNMQDEIWVHRGDEVVDCWEIAARGKLR